MGIVNYYYFYKPGSDHLKLQLSRNTCRCLGEAPAGDGATQSSRASLIPLVGLFLLSIYIYSRKCVYT